MTSSYPGALDAFSNPTSGDDLSTSVGGRTHSQMHADVNDALEATQAELGVNPSGSAASVAARFAALDTTVGGKAAKDVRVFDAVAYGAVVDGTTDDTAAWQAAVNAAAAAGGGVVTSSKNGVSVIAGALQDTSGANAQLVLPAIDYADSEAVGIAIVGLTPPPTVPSVIGATPIPDNHLVLKSTLAAGTGAVLGAKGPTGTFGEFTNVQLHLDNLTVRTVANPTVTGLDLHRVATVSVGTVVVDAGSFDVDALAQPTSSGSYGVRLPANNNGARVDVGRLDVVGFYTGVQHSEHLNAEHVVTWGCRVGLETNAGNHASHIKRLMAVHCTTPWKVTGAHAVDVALFDIEHANTSQGWRQTTYDIDDALNYLSGNVRWWSVLAGTGAHNVFTVNGASGVTKSRLGSAFSTGSGSLTVQDENGNVATSVTQIDFQGAGVTASAGTGEVVVTIPGGGGSGDYTYRDRLTAATGNNVLTLGAAPVANSPLVWVNGSIKWPTADYTISGATITFGSALTAGDVVAVQYRSAASTASASSLSGGGVSITDTFTRADSTTSMGTTTTGSKTWTNLDGTWGIDTNKGYCVLGPGGGLAKATVDATIADCTMSAVITSSGTPNCGFVLRATDASNCYLVEVGPGASYAPKIYKVVGGTTTAIATGTAVTFASGDTLSVVLAGTSITVKRNGTTVASVTDSTFTTQTKHGFYVYAPSVAGLPRFDDFSLTS